MQFKKVILVIVDISGYTHFVRTHKTTFLHAEEVIFELMEAVIDQAEFPLTLNKLEGDAAFLYAELADGQEIAVVRSVAQQVQAFFDVFRARARSLTENRAECACNACQRIIDLRLKAILHQGEAYIRKIRQFEELAGEDVILIHRLLKNSIPSQEYIAVTETVQASAENIFGFPSELRQENYEDLGNVRVRVYYPQIEI